jgi:hypothetical protein
MDCPICYELTNDFITTNCNHIFCINCIRKIKRCAMCRTELTRSKLCKEIKQRYLQTNNYENINTNINENINENADPLYIPLDFWFSGSPGLAIPFYHLSYDEHHYDLNTGETTIIPFTQEYIQTLVGDA